MKRNKLLVGLLLILFSINTSRLAQAYTNGEKESGKGDTTTPAAKATDKTTNLSAEEQLLLLNEKVRRLEEMVERQQRIIETLQPKANQVTETNATVAGHTSEAVHTETAIPSPAPAQPEGLNDEQNKKLDSLHKAFGQFTISGDLRFRYDGQFDQGFDAPVEQPDRNRLRVRARLQLAGAFHNNFDWAIRVATGSFTNPATTNQDATNFFTRKPVGFDRYFIRYNSKTEPAGIILQAGKFDYPWKRTELTFDNDIQPEGVAETIYFKGKGALKDARIIAFQLPLNEVSLGKDAVLFGGQLQSTIGAGNWTATGAATFLNFNQVDQIARSLGRPSTQVGGGLEVGTTNRVRRDANGNIIGFVTNYNILDLIGEVTYNGFNKYPITVVFNYARNMSDRLETLKEEDAYWTEFKVGRLKEKGDVELTYTFSRVEQDAVLGVFSFDDFLQTNSRNNRITFAYMVNNNVFVQFLNFFNERFNTLPNRGSRTQKRFQFDVNYRF
ncbi:MAG: putative porin [Acidobacteriota bacterium]